MSSLEPRASRERWDSPIAAHGEMVWLLRREVAHSDRIQDGVRSLGEAVFDLPGEARVVLTSGWKPCLEEAGF